ncbi:hypothetical protein BsWGS_25355 [Bradybaena similaris]
MAGCGPWTVSLLVISTLLNSALTQWNFTVLQTDALYSFYECSCIEKNCSDESITTSTLLDTTRTLSTTATTTFNTTTTLSTTATTTFNTTNESSTTALPTSKTTEAPSSSFRIQNCTCEKESQMCSVNTTSTASKNSTMFAIGSENFTCHTFQPLVSDGSDVCTITEETEQMNATIIFLTISSNETKYLNCSTVLSVPNLESMCDNTTTINTTTTAPAISTSRSKTNITTTPPTTTTPRSTTNTTGMIITVTIVAVNIVLAIGVCTFILCKRRQISVNIRRKEKALQEINKTANNVRPTSNTVVEDRDTTIPKTIR